MPYFIKEIFGPTLQGEGFHTGRVVSFVRFSGCNRWSGKESDRDKAFCKFCDTDFFGGTKMTSDEIVSELIKISKSKIVILSGGEASLQLDQLLIDKLHAYNFKVHLETNGSTDISHISGLDWVTVSPKQSFLKTELLRADEIKILWPPIHNEITPEKFKDFSCQKKYIQPVHDSNYEANLHQAVQKLYELDDWRLSLQTHKITGVR